MIEASDDPEGEKQDNPRTRERPSDQGRKAMMVIIALLLLVAAGTAWNVVSRTNAKEIEPEERTSVRPAGTIDASLQDTFATRLERRKQALRDARLPAPVRQLIPNNQPSLVQEVTKPLTPAEEWALQQELAALRALSKPMKVTGKWPDPPKEPRPAAPTLPAVEDPEVTPAAPETLDAKIDGYYKLLDQIEARQRAREVLP
jgi:hypothetical protein